MTKEDIIRMALEAGAKPSVENDADMQFLKSFAALVAAAEREECAKVALDYDQHAIAPAAIAAAIRSRGQA